MAYLKQLPQLETLKLVSLAGTTGKGFRSVGSLKQLRTLEVEALPLSDDDFSVLRNLIGLRVLTIQHVNLTDQGMEHLGGLRDLSKLTLGSHGQERRTGAHPEGEPPGLAQSPGLLRSTT